MLAARGDDPGQLDRILELDARRRELLQEEETLRAERKRGSKGPVADEAARERLRAMGDRIDVIGKQRGALESELHDLQSRLPNLIDEGVPTGLTEDDNVVVRTWGEPRQFDFEPLPSWELGERLGIIDMVAGAKLSGARF